VTAATWLPAEMTRPELDALISELEHEERLAHTALSVAPLGNPEQLAGLAGVAGDILRAYQDALDESIARMLAGEVPA
jgi:hypothetical protein